MAVRQLGAGFLDHPGNTALRVALAGRRLDAARYYSQVVRVVYRLLFLLVLDDGAYRRCLQELFESGAGDGGEPGLWETACETFHAVYAREAGVWRNAGIRDLFAPETCPDLEQARCEDSALRAAAQHLSALWRGDLCRRGDLAPQRVEELGLEYERLLGYQPVIAPAFDLTAGSERKQTGSYYTPPGLVGQLVESTLVPVMEMRLHAASTPEQQVEALLALRVCDPACGTGHFLLAAARCIALALARIRQGSHDAGTAFCATETDAQLYRSALHDVVQRCIYGVDRDPLAVALCNLGLWAEGEGGLDHHVKRGDSLIGLIDVAGWQECRLGARRGEVPAFFHWPLEFPEIFAAGGFDVVLANPPWEQLQPEEVEFFAAQGRPDIARLSGAARKAAIRDLEVEDAALAEAWEEHRRAIEARIRFIRESGRFPLTRCGKLNTYAPFMETVRSILHPAGRAGCIVPSGLITDDTTRRFFRELVDSRSLLSLYHFDNRRKLFPAVAGNITFCLMTLSGSAQPLEGGAEVAFFLHDLGDLSDPRRRFRLTAQDIELINPNTRTCPIFHQRRDAELTRSVHRRVPVFVRQEPEENPWKISFRQGIFNMTSDSHLFLGREQLEFDGWRLNGKVFLRGGDRFLPLYEAKMLHHFDHRWATCDRPTARTTLGAEKADAGSAVFPRYWVPEAEVENRIRGLWNRPWLLGYRLICRSTDERTVIGTVLPRLGCGNSVLMLYPAAGTPQQRAALVASLNSFALDYIARQKLGGINLNFHILKQLPVLPPSTYDRPTPWPSGERLDAWLAHRLLELVYTAWDLQPFARDLGYDGPPFRWDAGRRFLLRCELDAAFFHLYGMQREEVAYVLDTFPGVKRKDDKRYGEYRTKRGILEMCERLDA